MAIQITIQITIQVATPMVIRTIVLIIIEEEVILAQEISEDDPYRFQKSV